MNTIIIHAYDVVNCSLFLLLLRTCLLQSYNDVSNSNYLHIMNTFGEHC